ncbi:MAG: hypothetical protein ABJA79_02840 [Parafilimonas sp.]
MDKSQVSNRLTEHNPKKRSHSQFDTSKVAIIPFCKTGNYPFDNNYKQAILTQADINESDSLLIKPVTDYNNSLEQDYKQFSILMIVSAPLSLSSSQTSIPTTGTLL